MKLKIIATALFSMFLVASAQAGSIGIGVSGNIAGVSADGTETEGTSGSETETNQSATAGNTFMFGSVYAEYGFGEGGVTIGIDIVPGAADINNKTLSRTDASQDGYVAQDTGTVKANAEISDHTTYYVEVGKSFYGKLGYSEVDINVKQTNDSGYGTYPDKTLDAWTYALGYKGSWGENGVFKFEGFMTDYDSFSATSTTSNTVKADLDVVGGTTNNIIKSLIIWWKDTNSGSKSKKIAITATSYIPPGQ